MDADELRLGGNFDWDGVIIFIGSTVTVSQSGTARVEGSLMIDASSVTINVTGTFDVAYSSDAINNTKNNLTKKYYYAVNSVREN